MDGLISPGPEKAVVESNCVPTGTACDAPAYIPTITAAKTNRRFFIALSSNSEMRSVAWELYLNAGRFQSPNRLALGGNYSHGGKNSMNRYILRHAGDFLLSAAADAAHAADGGEEFGSDCGGALKNPGGCRGQ